MTAVRVSKLPADDSTNGWSRILPPRTPRSPLDGEVRADWAVVGAGFAGLAAARRLAENRPDDKVVLLEAQEAGEGASGRNSGFGIDLPHSLGNALEELEGPQRVMRLSRAAIAYLEAVVADRKIDCQWSQPGKYHAAVSEKGRRDLLEPFARELDALGEPYRWLEREELAQEIGTSYNHAAIHTPGCILMQPAALTRGLAETLPENVTLYERSPVTRVDYENGVRLTTPGGSLFATNMILAANGFAEQFGFFRGRLLHLVAYASISRPLTPAEREALGGLDNWGVTPANTFAGVTMRLTPDQRILIRQRIVYGPSMRRSDADRAAARRGHLRILRDRFPMLPGLDLEHTWSGMLCLSQNHGHGFGRIGPSVYGASCQNAIGVTKGTISGVLAADLAAGRDNPLIADMEALGTPGWMPPRPFLDIGIQARLAWELWRSRAER